MFRLARVSLAGRRGAAATGLSTYIACTRSNSIFSDLLSPGETTARLRAPLPLYRDGYPE